MYSYAGDMSFSTRSVHDVARTAEWDDEALFERSCEYHRLAFELVYSVTEKIDEVVTASDLDFVRPFFNLVVHLLEESTETHYVALAYQQLCGIADTGVVTHATVHLIKATLLI